MRRVRTFLMLTAVGAALVLGAGAPAQGAASADPRPVTAAADSYLFGYYYTVEACRYFGDSLVQGGAWGSYTCAYQWHPYDKQYYWYLYVW
ncbi:hypothetical protein [Micromonospora rosaria]|nr:hypothetical protein [Micromonospora rosaria]